LLVSWGDWSFTCLVAAAPFLGLSGLVTALMLRSVALRMQLGGDVLIELRLDATLLPLRLVNGKAKSDIAPSHEVRS
jgi:hypothetical protein